MHSNTLVAEQVLSSQNQLLSADLQLEDSHQVFFSTEQYVKAWVQAFPERDVAFPIQVSGSGLARTLWAIKRPVRFGRRELSSGHSDDFCWSPGWNTKLERSTVEGIVRQLKAFPTNRFVWRVRFDHGELAETLSSLGLTFRRVATYVLSLTTGYEHVFAGFNDSRRNEVRKAHRRGLVIRQASSIEDLSNYQQIYSDLARNKAWGFVYPLEFTLALLASSTEVRFLVAEHEGRAVAGALFVRDGRSVMYVHGAADRSKSDLFASTALIDEGIRWATDLGVDFFNFGNAGSSEGGLAHYKLSFGSEPKCDWVFEWRSQLFSWLARLKGRLSLARTLLPFRPVTLGAEAPKSTTTPPLWSERARLGTLNAVLNATGTDRENMLLHSAHEVGAARVKPPGLNPDKHILLDFGCGNGRMSRTFAAQGWTVLGGDICFEMLQSARRLGWPERGATFQIDGTSIPLADESVDAVFVCAVLKYSLFPTGSRCLHGCPQTLGLRRIKQARNRPPIAATSDVYPQIAREMYRVLRPQGKVVQLEMWVNATPETFLEPFRQAGFRQLQSSVLRRYTGFPERTLQHLSVGRLSDQNAARLGKIVAELRLRLDKVDRIGGGFKDYLFVWQKPVSSPKQVEG